ncbi:MAG: hypothetical protein ND895_17920 [Pyrinomonadaceae bacterium]|nr:hypothetical protein [Pyrinomonadaceae bacterium]
MTPEEAEYILPPCIGFDFPLPEAFYTRDSDFEKFDYRTNEPRSPLKTVKLR